MPLFSTGEHEQVVERALVIFGSAEIVGKTAEDTTKIMFERTTGQLSKEKLRHPEIAVRVVGEHPDLHRVVNIANNRAAYPEAQLFDATNLPSFDRNPILTPRTDSPAEVLSAHSTRSRQFWYAQRGQTPVLVTPAAYPPFYSAYPWEAQLIEKQLDDYAKYGANLGSILHGERIHPIVASRDRDHKYKFTHTSSKEAMVSALQTDGKFKFKALDGNKYMVRAANFGAEDQLPFELKVEPASTVGKLTKVAKGITGIRLR